jgi:hypothetical protein
MIQLYLRLRAHQSHLLQQQQQQLQDQVPILAISYQVFGHFCPGIMDNGHQKVTTGILHFDVIFCFPGFL